MAVERSVGHEVTALASIDPAAPLILDFDETYWLRNSTEAFLDSVRPAWPAALLLAALDLARPWRLLPGPDKDHVWRDWLRVLAVVVLFPWSLRNWRRVARELGPKWRNPALAPLVANGSEGGVWIVTNGFRPIVAPLVDALPEAERPTLLASPLLSGFAWRRRGKRAVVEAALGGDRLRAATVVTDNDEDGELLAAVATPLHRKWPDARFEPAHEDAYLPFYYMERIKRPRQGHLKRAVLFDELILVLLVYLWASASLPTFLAIVVLHGSFWVIYEILYMENDRVAARREADPRLSEAYHDKPHRFSEPLAWLTGLGLGLIGVALLQLAPAPDMPGLLEGAALWALLLLSLRGMAFVYNHVDKATRVPLYLVLQAFKLGGLALLLPLPVAALALIGAHLTAQWLPYIAYRDTRAAVEAAWGLPLHFYRFVLALVLATLFLLALWSAGLPIELAAAGQLGLGLAFFAFKARRELRAMAQKAHWLRPRG
jgi:hypothetical protein